MRADYPILEYDPSPEAIIEPSKTTEPMDIPQHCVVCFFQDVIKNLKVAGRLKELGTMKSEAGIHPFYSLELDGKPVTLFHPGVGAPMAAALLDEMIAKGCRKFIACGGCGVLDPSIAVGHLIVPVEAVRDEGTSYHYLPPSRTVAADPVGVAAIEEVLKLHQIEYLLAKVWTTDAFYRETVAKTAMRKAEGCLGVEMEASAFFAVAQFRRVQFAQILYGGDVVIHEGWDPRGWDDHTTVREKLVWLAAEACLLL